MSRFEVLEALVGADEPEYDRARDLTRADTATLAKLVGSEDPLPASVAVTFAALTGKRVAVDVIARAALSPHVEVRAAGAAGAAELATLQRRSGLVRLLTLGPGFRATALEVRDILTLLSSDDDDDVRGLAERGLRDLNQFETTPDERRRLVVTAIPVIIFSAFFATAMSAIILRALPEVLHITGTDSFPLTLPTAVMTVVVAGVLLERLYLLPGADKKRRVAGAQKFLGDYQVRYLLGTAKPSEHRVVAADVHVLRVKEPIDDENFPFPRIAKLANFLLAHGFSGNKVAWLSLGFVTLTAVLMVIDFYPAVAAVLFVIALLLDAVDGRIAQKEKQLARRARLIFIDYVIDRLSDIIIAAGFFALLSRHGSPYAYLAGLLAVAALSVSYVRAEGESVGVDAAGGPFERWIRNAILAATLIIGHTETGLVVAIGVTAATVGSRIWRGLRSSSTVFGETTFRDRKSQERVAPHVRGPGA